jgi:hypothetical protein
MGLITFDTTTATVKATGSRAFISPLACNDLLGELIRPELGRSSSKGSRECHAKIEFSEVYCEHQYASISVFPPSRRKVC